MSFVIVIQSYQLCTSLTLSSTKWGIDIGRLVLPFNPCTHYMDLCHMCDYKPSTLPQSYCCCWHHILLTSKKLRLMCNRINKWYASDLQITMSSFISNLTKSTNNMTKPANFSDVTFQGWNPTGWLHTKGFNSRLGTSNQIIFGQKFWNSRISDFLSPVLKVY